MTLRQDLIRSCAGLRLVKPTTIEEVEEELAAVRSKIEPLQHAEAALLARREQLWRNEHARGNWPNGRWRLHDG